MAKKPRVVNGSNARGKGSMAHHQMKPTTTAKKPVPKAALSKATVPVKLVSEKSKKPATPTTPAKPEAKIAPTIPKVPTVPTVPPKPVSKPAVAAPPVPIPRFEPPPAPPAPPAPAKPVVTTPPDSAPVSHPPLLFEIGWEVCWQLGGIYTVLRTKADAMAARWDDRYCLIGPYNPATAPLEFEERPSEGIIRDALDKLRAMGIPCHFGRWLVPGRPRVILLDYRARFAHLDHDKYLMWKDHGISVPSGDGEVNEVVAFGFTVAEFFRALSEVGHGRTILAHFHEWMAGVAVPRIAHNKWPITTLFTTHATLLGRYLASDSPDFYNHLPFINADEQAGKYQIWPRYAIERAAAHACTVFTTVSEVTAYEAEKLLGRRPDAILPNGLNIQRFAAMHEFQNLHRQYKEQIHEFVMGHFFPAYHFPLDDTLYFFTSGRYEYTNKGIDLFIEALYRLNQRMKTMKAGLPRPTVVGFIITRAGTRNINVNVLQNQSMFDELHSTCLAVQAEIGQRLFKAAVSGRVPSAQEIMPEDTQVRLKRAIHAWRNRRQPTIVTHDLHDDAGDPVLKHLRHRGLFNAEDDPVKVVFHPEFVTATSPLISLDYPQFVRGCNLGVFPSYYEPWGYTPMESIAMGVPAVTTDLSGFGAYVQRHIPNSAEQGVLVLDRSTQGFDKAADDLASYFFDYVQLNRRQRIELRNKVESLGEKFDWSQLVKHYHAAHDLALERVGAPRIGKFEIKMV